MSVPLRVSPIDETTFSAHVEQKSGQNMVTMVGTADTVARQPLETFLADLHAEAVRTSAKAITVDLRELEFMNSSCFKGLLTWVGLIQQLEEGKRYSIKILSDPEKYWQRRSLHALRCFATDLIDVQS